MRLGFYVSRFYLCIYLKFSVVLLRFVACGSQLFVMHLYARVRVCVKVCRMNMSLLSIRHTRGV